MNNLFVIYLYYYFKMGKNKTGGKKHKRGKNVRDFTPTTAPVKERNQHYALITKRLGGSHLQVKCDDGVERMCVIPGKFRKRVWVAKDDIILVGVRSFQDDKVDMYYKYNAAEVNIIAKNDESVLFDLGGSRYRESHTSDNEEYSQDDDIYVESDEDDSDNPNYDFDDM